MTGTLPSTVYRESQLYTTDQIYAYYERIALPEYWRIEPGTDSAALARDPERGLAFLTALQRFHLANIPFENLDLHYNRHHDIFIDLPHLFEKIVARGAGRGGYCMEVNGLFGAVLRSLGFDLYPTAARVYTASGPLNDFNGAQFTGWSHMVHIVMLGARRYQVDVGFGVPGPSSPLLLDETSRTPKSNTPPQLERLRNIRILDSVRSVGTQQPTWVYEVQHKPAENSMWKPIYCFSELEFLPSDFEVINFYTSQSPTIWFRRDVVCTRYLLKNSNVIGSVALYSRGLKRREHGEKVLDLDFKSEEERVNALKEHLGISLTVDEKVAIEGYPSQIR